MKQRGHRWVHEIGRGVPPVIDQHVEIVARLHLVPPQGRVDEHVSRFEFRHFARCRRLGIAGKAIEIGRGEIDHRHHLAARGGRQRTGIEVRNLFGRKQRETAVPDRADRRVVRHVPMRRGDGAVADPDAGERRVAIEQAISSHERVVRAQAGEIAVEIGRADIQRGRVRCAMLRSNLREKRIEHHALTAEIHAGDRGVIMEPSADLRFAGIADHGFAAVKAQQIVHCRLPGFQTGAHQRPVARRASHDRRHAFGNDRVEIDRTLARLTLACPTRDRGAMRRRVSHAAPASPRSAARYWPATRRPRSPDAGNRRDAVPPAPRRRARRDGPARW